MKNLAKITISLSLALIFLAGCKKNPDDNSINIFTIQDDKNLGIQVRNEILSNPAEYPLLDSVQYKPAYDYLRSIVSTILNGNKVFYKDEFEWTTYIIRDDQTLNAFCVPGGYIFVYTGLIKYLDAEDQLAGVLGHEIAHADRRHSTDQMTKQYGIETLLGILLGENQGQLATIAANVVLLKYSRDAEREADKYGVSYLCPTIYNADASSIFFEKLLQDGSVSEENSFFSTHPSPDERVQSIRNEKNSLGCAGTSTNDAAYQDFKNNLIP